MKRIFNLIFITAAAVLLFSLTGCGPDNGGENDVTLSVSLTESNIGKESAYSDLVITSNSPWRISVTVAGSSAAARWITSEKTSGSGNQTVRLSIEENTGEQRSADITVSVGTVTRKATLTQDGVNTTLSVSLTESEVGSGSATSALVVKSNSTWNVSVTMAGTNTPADWVTPEKTNGSGDETIRLTIQQNNGQVRAADITVGVGSVSRKVTLTQAGVIPPGPVPKWMELPELVENADRIFYTHYATMNGERARNYSILYDKNHRAGMWVAYPLCEDHSGSLNRPGSWNQDPEISLDYQVILKSSYGASAPGGNNNIYARGHQIPNGDRNGVRAMQLQTFYYTNSTPQNQNGFNGSIWQRIEDHMRGQIPARDTVWVVTGPVFKTVGGNETVTQIRNTGTNNGYGPNDPKGLVDLPNYYFRIGLKKKGDTYTTIAFWLEHKYYTGVQPSGFVTTVRDVEEKTGFNFFANLPQSVQDQIETQQNKADWGF